MKHVRELSAKQRQEICDILDQDGFKNIKDNEISISFSKRLRNFEILSTDIYNNDDMGIRTDFDFASFLEDKTNYELKSRHSTSLQEKIDKLGSVEEACKALGWEITRMENLNQSDTPWKSEIHVQDLIEVRIGTLTHVILDDQVYAGALAPLWAMGTETSLEALSGTHILEHLRKLNSQDDGQSLEN